MRQLVTCILACLVIAKLALGAPLCPPEPNAPCWTTTGPAKFCSEPVSGAVLYRAYLAGTTYVLTTTTDPTRIVIACPSDDVGPGLDPGTPFQIEVAGVDSAGREGPRSPRSKPTYCTPACGADLDGSRGAVTAADLNVWTRIARAGCHSR